MQALFVDLLKERSPRLDLPYLYRAVTNRCLNVLRDGANRRRLLARHDDALRGPVRTLCEGEVIGMDLLGKLLGTLDEAHAEVLVLRFFDDLTQEEIAEMTHTSRKTVGKRLNRIRDEVLALLGGARG